MQIDPIPYSFFSRRARLTWPEAHWAYRRQLIGWASIVDLACARVAQGSEDAQEVELCGLGKMEAHRVGDLLRELAEASSDREDHDAVKGKWLYLTLAWLFENRDRIPDPLGQVELVYADFDYPEEIASFVRYMPPARGYDPARRTGEENELRLFRNWQSYLESAATRYADLKTR